MQASDQIIEAHEVVTNADRYAPAILSDATRLSRERIKTAMQRGAVWLTRDGHTQRLRRAKRSLKVGDELHLYYNLAVLSETPAQPTLIADNDAYSVWAKPRGTRSQGSKWGDHCTLVRWAEQHLTPERSGFTVHRLDRAACGLMLVAHSKAIAAALAEKFRNREVEKHYLALVAGEFPPTPEPLKIDQPIDGKPALSRCHRLRVDPQLRFSLVRIEIETGRKHQIRRHLAACDHAILGDRLYGHGASDGLDLQLVASRLAFTCPVAGDLLEFELPDVEADWLGEPAATAS